MTVDDMGCTMAKGYTCAITQLEMLPLMVSARRFARKLSLRQCADEIGIANSTLLRIETCRTVSMETAALALRWLAKTS